MSRRKIHSTRVGSSCAVNIYKDSYAGEYVVQQVIHGKVEGGKEGGGDFVDNKQDARQQAAVAVRRLRKMPACRR